MQDDLTPPTPVPSAAQPPYPPHPEKQVHIDIPVAAKNDDAPQESVTPTFGVLGATLIGGAVAGAIGLLVAVPLLRGRTKKTSGKTRAKQRTRRKS
jgi:hypothetical protein